MYVISMHEYKTIQQNSYIAQTGMYGHVRLACLRTHTCQSGLCNYNVAPVLYMYMRIGIWCSYYTAVYIFMHMYMLCIAVFVTVVYLVERAEI